jgi:thymidylate synthase (FAD)
MKVSLVSVTKPTIQGISNAEELISYCARVSNPSNQFNTETAPKLLRYCIEHGHWSIFEQCSMGIEIRTSRAIAAQILRHRSFSFQEFSQRYSSVTELEKIELRKQGKTNRQVGDIPITIEQEPELFNKINQLQNQTVELYEEMVSKGVAKECARMILPLTTSSVLYVHGTTRSWIHYLQLRTQPDTQKEHREIALEIQKIFIREFPSVSQALKWVN